MWPQKQSSHIQRTRLGRFGRTQPSGNVTAPLCSSKDATNLLASARIASSFLTPTLSAPPTAHRNLRGFKALISKAALKESGHGSVRCVRQ